jgi:uncharacterized membrane protein
MASASLPPSTSPRQIRANQRERSVPERQRVPERHGRSAVAMNKARFESFSDGVFAFAITLLILSIVLPPFAHRPSDRELTAALLGLWPNVLALFRLIGRIDRMTVFLNLGLLGITVFIPFATSTLGSYMGLRSSAFLYGATLTGCSTMYNLMLAHLVRSQAFHAEVSEANIRATVAAYRVGWATYTAAMLVSLVAPIVSVILYFLIAGYYLVPRGVDTDIS